MKNAMRVTLALLVLSGLMLFFAAVPSSSETTTTTTTTTTTVAATDTTSTYVGAQKCKMCHMAQYRTWEATSMSKAWEAIKEATDKEKCYACHTTGYGQPGGFTSFEATPNLVGVQCESCHGPGSAHMAVPMSNRELKRATIQRHVTTCANCHNPHVPDKAVSVRSDTAAR